MRQQGSRRRWCPRQHALGHEHRFVRVLTTRVGRLRLKRCGSVPALTVFVAYAPTSDYDDEEVEAFYVELEKFYKEDHTFYKVMINAKIGPRRSPEKLHIGNHGLVWNEQGERLSEFITSTKTIHGNSQHTYCLIDASVVPKFYTGPDHRLLRVRFRFSRQGEKAAKFKERRPRTIINWDLYTSLASLC
ncbi:unnamed protein product [Heligmosomoides polygyrus]|uniref:Staygreen domain-containing protein n=1 Tax=Heligmosomoides polygyrus TaxID=6339 RepID=A0A183FPW8_HELPZ|nr:unnamed protein product [Heligmosomoides polygyrus]